MKRCPSAETVIREEEVTAGSAAVAGVRGGTGTVEPSITMLEAPGGREKVVPETTTGGPPGVRVWPDMTRSGPWAGFEGSGIGVNVAPLMVMGVSGGEGARLEGRGAVEVPSMISDEAPGAREKVVPETITGEPPGVRVWPEMMRSGPGLEPEPAIGVKVAPATVMGQPGPEPAAAGVGAGRGTVEPPMIIDGGNAPPLPSLPLLPEPGRDRVVPDTTTGGPPGVRV